ncbi:MAG: TRAP transporter small permease [Burkholderiaceae bacterium]|nr:TRAP transporter small permease [Burkholderiaceae bacterium]
MRGLERILGYVSATSLFAMMALTFADVIGRKYFGNSIVGSFEVTELLMLVLIFTALPLTSLRGEHVVFDLLDRSLSERARHWQKQIANLLTAGMLLGAAWLVFERATRTAEFGDNTAQLRIELAPFHFMVALMLVVAAAMHVYLIATTRPESASAELESA